MTLRRRVKQLPTSKIFSLAGWIFREVPAPEIVDLSRKLRSFLRGRRRGKLRLPKHLPKKVRQLSDLSKAQIRRVIHYINCDGNTPYAINDRIRQYCNQVLPSTVYFGVNSKFSSTANEVGTHRLRQGDWPEVSGNPWPSSPTFEECLEMSRRGLVARPLQKHSIQLKNCIERSEVSNDIRLASRIVSHEIVGIRLGEEVPERFLPYFRHRLGFLILTTRHNLPAGLVRFLIGRWICNPFSLWLKENCRFKNFLKRHRRSDFITSNCAGSPQPMVEKDPVLGTGSPIQPDFNFQLKPALLDEMDDEFLEFFNRLPD